MSALRSGPLGGKLVTIPIPTDPSRSTSRPVDRGRRPSTSGSRRGSDDRAGSRSGSDDCPRMARQNTLRLARDGVGPSLDRSSVRINERESTPLEHESTPVRRYLAPNDHCDRVVVRCFRGGSTCQITLPAAHWRVCVGRGGPRSGGRTVHTGHWLRLGEPCTLHLRGSLDGLSC